MFIPYDSCVHWTDEMMDLYLLGNNYEFMTIAVTAFTEPQADGVLLMAFQEERKRKLSLLLASL